MKRIIHFSSVMVMMLRIDLIPVTWAYKMVKSSPSIIFDPLLQVLEYSSYWFLIVLVLLIRKYVEHSSQRVLLKHCQGGMVCMYMLASRKYNFQLNEPLVYVLYYL